MRRFIRKWAPRLTPVQPAEYLREGLREAYRNLHGNPENRVKSPVWATRKGKKKLTKQEYEQVLRDYYHSSDAYLRNDLGALVKDLSSRRKAKKIMENESEDFMSDVDLLSRSLVHLSRNAQMIIDESTGTSEGYVEFDPTSQSIVISWKGSQDLRDWGTDAAAQIWSSDVDEIVGRDGIVLENLGATLHVPTSFWDRFQDCYKSMRSGLEVVLSSLGLGWDSPTLPYQIRINGHSLGGALSEICGAVLQLLHPNWNIVISTFAPARGFKSLEGIDDLKPIQKLAEQQQRFTTHGDAVNNLPLLATHLGTRNLRLDDDERTWQSDHFRTHILEKLKKLDPELENPKELTEFEASGILTRPHKPKLHRSLADFPSMKARMAYVRSFKKKK